MKPSLFRLLAAHGCRVGDVTQVVNRFCEVIGVTRSKMTAKIELLEQIARQELDATAPRRFVVVRPLKVTLEGIPPEGKTLVVANHPKEDMGTRTLVLRRRHARHAGRARPTWLGRATRRLSPPPRLCASALSLCAVPPSPRRLHLATARST